jgi:hypothetical protein
VGGRVNSKASCNDANHAWPPEQWPKIPLLRSVPVEALDEHVYVIEENPGIQEEWIGNKVLWAMHDQQTAWPKISLSEENSFNATV